MPKISKPDIGFGPNDLEGKNLDELRAFGRKLNQKREEALVPFKLAGSLLQEAMAKQEKVEINVRRRSDPDYDKKHQGVGISGKPVRRFSAKK